MNIWAAIVRIVEIFVTGGKLGHALAAFVTLMVVIALVAIGVESKGRALAESMIAPLASSLALARR